MSSTLIALHSILRWAVFGFGIIALTRAVMGARAKSAWTPADQQAGFRLVLAVDTQLLVGLLLYFVFSAWTKSAMAGFGAAMKDRTMRFWAVEHPTAMFLAVVFVHVGRVLVRRTEDATKKHERARLFFGLTLLAVAIGTPWPFLPYGRPLFPF